MKQWSLEEAILIVRALQPASRDYGYHVALGGGVLNKGYSDKDIDLYFLPMGGFDKGVKSNPDGLLAYLQAQWGKHTLLCKEYAKKSKKVIQEPEGAPPELGNENAPWFEQPVVPRLGRRNLAPPPQWLVEPNNLPWAIQAEPTEQAFNDSFYAHAVMFMRNGHERIDCFIMRGN